MNSAIACFTGTVMMLIGSLAGMEAETGQVVATTAAVISLMIAALGGNK